MSRLRAIRKTAQAVLRDPGRLVATARVAIGALSSPRAEFDPPTEVHFSHEFSHRFGAVQTCAAPAARVVAQLLDFGSYGTWFGLHVNWPVGVPDVLAQGSEFAETLRVMGTPARVNWTVTHYDPPRAFAMEGTGPMGVVTGLWFTVTETADGTALSISGGFHSDTLRGPIGTMVVNALQSATGESLRNLAALLGSGRPAAAPEATAAQPELKPAGPRPQPLRHTRTGKPVDPWAPVIIGAGQAIHRSSSPSPGPLGLAADAARAALSEAVSLEPYARIGVSVVPSMSWAYGDQQAALLAQELGIDALALTQSAPLGGDGPQRLINDAAQAISDGLLDAVVVAGGEAFAALSAAQQAGHGLDWNRPPAGWAARTVGSDCPGTNDAEDAAGLMTPVYMYALMESALRARLGRAPDTHTHALAQLWSQLSAVAAGNPYAWLPQAFTAAQIAQTGPDNRPVAAPYPKLMTANLTVDQGAAVVLTSAAAATKAGIPQDHWVFIHAGAHAEEEWYVSTRHDLAAAPAIAAIGRAALGHTGIGIDEVSLVDLYSCFPYAVQVAALELGLDVDNPDLPLTQTGGLTFAGGPLNNYSLHGVAALVAGLRKQPDAYGIATALGWFATKHAIGVYSQQPPRQRFVQIDAGLRMTRPPAREVLQHFRGPATVEAYTVTYSATGDPAALILSGLTSGGQRTLVHSADVALAVRGATEDLLGLRMDVGDGLTIAPGPGDPVAARAVHSAPLPVPPLIVEWDGYLCVITLNRPAVRNAIDRDLALRLEAAIDNFEADPRARVAILTGADGNFCTGMDLKAAAAGEFPLAERRGLLGLTGQPPAKPLIAAVEGYALAGGFELALAADLIVAANDAQFGLPEAKRGLVAASGGVLRLAQRVPRNTVLELAYTGDPVSAGRLHTLGVVNELTAPGAALAGARDLAARVAASAPLSLALSKQIADSSPDWPSTDGYQNQAEIGSTAAISEDAAEGMRAFAERRTPNWAPQSSVTAERESTMHPAFDGQVLRGRTLLMSGGSRGIGLAIGIAAGRLGANVVLLAKTGTPNPKLPGTIHTAAADIEAAGGQALAVVGDVRAEASVTSAVSQAVERFGGIDIVVNNASAIDLSGTEAVPVKKFDLMQQIQLRGTFLLTRAALPTCANRRTRTSFRLLRH